MYTASSCTIFCWVLASQIAVSIFILDFTEYLIFRECYMHNDLMMEIELNPFYIAREV